MRQNQLQVLTTTDYHATRRYAYPHLSTGGSGFGTGNGTAEILGNQHGNGIMNSLCEFGTQTGSGVRFDGFNVGSHTNVTFSTENTTHNQRKIHNRWYKICHYYSQNQENDFQRH